jgi:mono/diheme cytochrome c family protein
VKNVLYAAAATLVIGVLQDVPSRAQSAANAEVPSPGNGKVVYLRAGCDSCHGTVGHGGAGARLAPNPLPLPAFQNWVRKGTPGWSVRGGMPAYSVAIVSDKELADIRAFLASLPAPPAAKDVPLLNP